MVTAPVNHVGSPTHVGPLSVFPVWTDAPVPRHALRTSLPKGATIDEVAEGSVVERLSLHNPTDSMFLLPGGSVFDGGWQHRVLVHSVLADARTDVDLDVRCVEQGRWDGTGQQRLHGRRAPLAVRGALRGIRTDRQPLGRAGRADQGDVWNRVHRYERTMGSSASSSLVEVTDRLEDQAGDVLARLQPLPGQRGVLIGIGGHPVVLEVFDHPRTLTRQWGAIITSVLADAHLVPARPTTGRRARIFAQRVSERTLQPWADAGAATAVEARDDLAVIDAIATRQNNVIHLSALNARHELVGAA